MFKNVKIKTKLLLGFILIAIIAGIIGSMSIIQMRKLAKADKILYENVALPLGYTVDLATIFQQIQVNIRDAVMAENKTEKNNHLLKIKSLSTLYNENLIKYEQTLIDEKDKKNFEELKAAKNDYIEHIVDVEKALNENDTQAIKKLRNGLMLAANERLQKATNELTNYQVTSGKNIAINNENLAKNIEIILWIIIGIGILLAIVLGLLIASNIQKIIKLIITETRKLTTSAVAGKLDIRGDEEKINPEFREIISGVNKTLDAMIGPLNVAAEYVDRIAKGDIPPKISDNYNGDFNEIKNNLNLCIDSLNGLVHEINNMSEQHNLGDIDVKIDTSKFEGVYQKMADGINIMVAGHISVKKKAMACIKEFGEGNFEANLEKFPGKKAFINDTIEQMRSNLKLLIKDTHILVDAAIKGQLSTRVDAAQHKGDYKKIVEGINNTLDSLVGFIDAMPAPAMIIDNDFNIQYVNEAAAKLGGRTSKQVQGIKCYDHFKTGDCKTDNCACQRAIASRHKVKSETIAKPGNQELEIEYAAIPIKDKSGQIIGAFEVITDQTEIKQNLKRIEKVGAYQKLNTENLIHNLEQLAKGNLNLQFISENADMDTMSNKEMFDKINSQLNSLVNINKEIVEKAKLIAAGHTQIELKPRSDNDELMYSFIAIVNSIAEVVDKIKLISNGDLMVHLTKRSAEDILVETLLNMVNNLKNVVSEVSKSAEYLSTSSEEMSSTSQQMSQGASEQASSSEEVTSSMEEMAASIQQNTDNAQQTEKIAIKAAEDINESSKAVELTVTSMKTIAEKIEIIGEIARKTDLLAINAAVEAARAGEHGRGFAVVAAEVRKLAENSQIAADEINELSKRSVEIAEKSGKLLSAVVPDIEKTAKLVKEISASSYEQNAGADQVNSAIQQLNQVTQQNAAASEELATSTEELASQAQLLKDAIAFFKIEEEKQSITESNKIKFNNKNHNNKYEYNLHNNFYNSNGNKKVVNKGVHIKMNDNKDEEFERM